MSNTAWQRHGCYRLGSDQYFNFPLQDSLIGCMDDWNSLDHFDPTADTRRLMKRMYELRTAFPKLQDGFGLSKGGNWTHFIQRPGSNQTATEMGLWAASRTGVDGQNFTSPDILLLYMNDNQTTTYQIKCNDKATYLQAPFQSGTTIRNLFFPYDTIKLIDGVDPFNTGKRGCTSSITMNAFGFAAYVPDTNWITASPVITKFEPGHDARLISEVGDTNATTIPIALEFNVPMTCDAVTKAITVSASSSGHGSNPTITGAKCSTVTQNPKQSRITGVDPSAFRWEATLTGVPDGIISLVVTNAPAAAGNANTGVSLILESISIID